MTQRPTRGDDNAHRGADCWPDPRSCLVCASECMGCGEWKSECRCPDLPNDEGGESA